MVSLHILPIFSFLAKMLSFLCKQDNIFARNENIGKTCKQTITWTGINIYGPYFWTVLFATHFFTNFIVVQDSIIRGVPVDETHLILSVSSWDQQGYRFWLWLSLEFLWHLWFLGSHLWLWIIHSRPCRNPEGDCNEFKLRPS